MKTGLGERIGQMNQVVTVYQQSITGYEVSGSPIYNLVEVATIYCALDYRLRGSEEFIVGYQVRPQSTILLYTYKRTDINTEMVIGIVDKTYRIDSILPHEDNLFMTLELVSNDYGSIP